MGDVSDSGGGAVSLSNSLYPAGSEYGVKSMLCTGAAWDSMLDFVKDSSHNVTSSTSWGNFKSSETYEVNRGKYGTLQGNGSVNFNDILGTYLKEKGSGVLLTTGATERNSSKNIYDVAGNCVEWTTEALLTDVRIQRGGDCFFSSGDTSARYLRDEGVYADGYPEHSFRPILYVKL